MVSTARILSRISIALGCLIASALPILVFALNNPGSASNPSNADFELTLTVPTLFRISGFGDLAFGSYSGNGNLTLNDNVCVWTNTAAREYRVTARGDGTSFAFVVSKVGDTSKQIPYTVRWNDVAGITGNIALAADTISPNQTNANDSSTDCSSGTTSTGNYQVTFDEADLLSATSGSYTGTLSFTISAPT